MTTRTTIATVALFLAGLIAIVTGLTLALDALVASI